MNRTNPVKRRRLSDRNSSVDLEPVMSFVILIQSLKVMEYLISLKMCFEKPHTFRPGLENTET
jgi:hypothetical protein